MVGDVYRKKEMVPGRVFLRRVLGRHCSNIETLVETNCLTQEVGYQIVHTYALLSTFIDDDEADRVNQLFGRAQQNELDWLTEEGKIVQDAIRDVAGSLELENEINEFIKACYKRPRA